MAKELFNRYIWLVDTIYRAKRITFEEINEKWIRNSMSEGMGIPLKTFHNHRKAIEETFDINIVCDKKDGYKYYIENVEDIEKGGIRAWLLNTFAVNNLINESHHLKKRILFEHIPSGKEFLTPIIEAMRDGHSLEMQYKSFWKQKAYTTEIEPYFVKVFRQRWYMIARNIYNNSMRVYALDRILGLLQTGHTFTMPQDFDSEEYFYNSFGVIKQDNCPPEIIELKVYGTKREYIRSLPLHHSQEEIESGKDWAVFRYYVAPTYDFIQEILSHGYEVEIIAPAHLKEEIRWQAAIVASR